MLQIAPQTVATLFATLIAMLIEFYPNEKTKESAAICGDMLVFCSCEQELRMRERERDMRGHTS